MFTRSSLVHFLMVCSGKNCWVSAYFRRSGIQSLPNDPLVGGNVEDDYSGSAKSQPVAVMEHLVGRRGQPRRAQVHAMYLSDQKGCSQDPPLPRPHLRVGSGSKGILLGISAYLRSSEGKEHSSPPPIPLFSMPMAVVLTMSLSVAWGPTALLSCCAFHCVTIPNPYSSCVKRKFKTLAAHSFPGKYVTSLLNRGNLFF